MIPVNPNSAKVIDALARLDDEAFSWVVLALIPKAMLAGANLQVWPDGLGGFQGREQIERVREEAERYLKLSAKRHGG